MKQTIIGLAMGIFLAASPFLIMNIESNKIINIFIGAVLVNAGWYLPKSDQKYCWTNLSIGIWLLFSAWFNFFTQGKPYLWNNLLSGLILISLNLYFMITNKGDEISGK